jgi:hypothetical protein
MIVENSASVWDRLLATDENPLTKEAAEFVLRMRFSDADVRRVEELAERCQLGQLTAKERAEYEEFVRADTVLAIWKSRARMALRNSNNSDHG